jgi:hypothetical protein
MLGYIDPTSGCSGTIESMNDKCEAAHSRRAFLKTGGVLAGALVVPQMVSARVREIVKQPSPVATPLPSAPMPARATVAARPITSPRVVRPELMRRAMAALDRHSARGLMRDHMAIVDFSAPSGQPRMHLVNLGDGRSKSFLVAHGKGSDPSHTGWLQRFSNINGSEASCEGAFVTSDYYHGKHGRSQRLVGLDATNSNALERAIVVHGAWYSNPDMIRSRGMLGRSQGCFAVGERELADLFDRLGTGRMIYATKV